MGIGGNVIIAPASDLVVCSFYYWVDCLCSRGSGLVWLKINMFTVHDFGCYSIRPCHQPHVIIDILFLTGMRTGLAVLGQS